LTGEVAIVCLGSSRCVVARFISRKDKGDDDWLQTNNFGFISNIITEELVKQNVDIISSCF